MEYEFVLEVRICTAPPNRGMLYGTVMISAYFFDDVIFLLERIILHAGLHIVKNTTVSSSGGCVVEQFRGRVVSSNPVQVFNFFCFRLDEFI